MLEYAANRPRIAARQSSPHAMLIVISVHVAAIAALMSAKMDLPQRVFDPPIEIDLIKEPKPQADPEPRLVPRPEPSGSTLHQPRPDVPLPPAGGVIVDSALPLPSFDDIIGRNPDPQPRIEPAPPPPVPARTDARLLTRPGDLRPPYPESKLASGEEAVLTLRLTVDERGRVVAAEPVGRADGTFLAAARRHLLARWRYQPATEGGRAVASSFTVTLRFQLEG